MLYFSSLANNYYKIYDKRELKNKQQAVGLEYKTSQY
jgi:hypothetical protein